MVRLTRAQQQERTRAAVLAAARAEFAERGYADAKVDRIASRAELTRGAVYSNFPSKRALYLAVLVHSLTPSGDDSTSMPAGVGELSGSFDRPSGAGAGAGAGAGDPAVAADARETPGEWGRSHRGGHTAAAAGGSAGVLGGAADASGEFGRAEDGGRLAPVAGVADGLGAFARVWLQRLPLTGETSADGRLRLRTLTGVFDDEVGRAVLAQVARLEALLLALALESCRPGEARWARQVGLAGEARQVRHAEDARQVRLAELALTLLNGAGQLADTAPGFGDPFDVARACQHLAALDLADTWDPPHLPYVAPAQPVQARWEPPGEVLDQMTGRLVGLDADGVVVVLGADRLGAAEEAVRAARSGDQVTVVVVTGDPAETGRAVQLRVGDLVGCLRRVFEPEAWAGFRLVLDDAGAVASAVGVRDVDDAVEVAVRIEAGRILARAQGRGAAHAAAMAGR